MPNYETHPFCVPCLASAILLLTCMAVSRLDISAQLHSVHVAGDEAKYGVLSVEPAAPVQTSIDGSCNESSAEPEQVTSASPSTVYYGFSVQGACCMFTLRLSLQISSCTERYLFAGAQLAPG